MLVEIDPITSRLIADLLPKTEVVIPTPELHLAISQGYVVTRVYWWFDFQWSTDLFKDYFRTFLKDKLEASGVPKWIQTDQDWLDFVKYHHDELGIDLVREDMVPNASRKTGAKYFATPYGVSLGNVVTTPSGNGSCKDPKMIRLWGLKGDG